MRHPNHLTKHLLATLIATTLSACDLLSVTPSKTTNSANAAREGVLRTLAHHIYPQLYSNALTSAEALKRELDSWEGGPRDSTQEAWRDLANAWQRAELAQVGPAGASGLRAGGQDLRDLIYAFPLNNPCRVDQELALNSFSDAGWAARSVISARGIDALERLLFAQDNTNACDPAININRDGTWAALTPSEISARRVALARVLIDDLITSLTQLSAAWAHDAETTRALTEGGAPFSGQREALDQVYAAILYLDKVSRDLKLALPLGFSPECPDERERCPERLEHTLARMSRDALIANLEGFLMIFEGRTSLDASSAEEGLFGFDDLLADEGAAALSGEIIELATACLDGLRPLDADLAVTLRDDPEALLAVYDRLKALTDLLKSQLATVLNLSLPMEGAGDND